MTEELSKTLTRIRLGTNNADRNSEVILLALNQLLACSTFKAYVEKETPQMTMAKGIVKERIENFRQKKINKNERTDKLE